MSALPPILTVTADIPDSARLSILLQKHVFGNNIGTLLPSAKAASCPQLAEGDIRALTEGSGFDPFETYAVEGCGSAN